MVQVVHLAFEGPPEAFHWAVINATPNTGHAMRHAGLVQLGFECLAGILESSVAMEDGMCIRVLAYGEVKGVEHQLVVVARSGHFSFRFSAVKSRFRMFSAAASGVEPVDPVDSAVNHTLVSECL